MMQNLVEFYTQFLLTNLLLMVFGKGGGVHDENLHKISSYIRHVCPQSRTVENNFITISLFRYVTACSLVDKYRIFREKADADIWYVDTYLPERTASHHSRLH